MAAYFTLFSVLFSSFFFSNVSHSDFSVASSSTTEYELHDLDQENYDVGEEVLPICDGTNIVIPVLTQQNNYAEVNLLSTAVVNASGDILFSGGNSVELTSGFEVILGTTFEAVIGDCMF